VLYGRDLELARVDRLVAESRTGSGGAILIEGEAGIGKTALLEAAAERAADTLVLRARGLESESELPFSALAELTRPLLGGLAELPEPQRAALEGALALAPCPPGDRFAACAGLHALLAATAARQPLLLLIDDAHWLDASSATCFGFVGRRLADRPIAMLVASRPGELSRFDATDFERLDLGSLAPGAARELLGARHAELSARAGEAILAAAGGNPLALIELPVQLTETEGAGAVTTRVPLAAPNRLREAFTRRLGVLEPDARLALLVAAAAGSTSTGPIVAACRELGLGSGSLEPAEADGLIAISAEDVQFAHPLLRGVAYGEAEAADRRLAHRALAGSVGGEERGWHLAAAAVGPDEEAAAALEDSARHALERGGPAPAADALERAAALSVNPGDRARRLVAAGDAAQAGGMHSRSATLLAEAADAGDGEHRGEAVERLAMVSLYEAGNALDAHRMLVERGDELAPADPVRAATVLADAAVAATTAGDCNLALAAAEHAHRLLGDAGDPTQRAQVLSILGWSLAMRGEAAQAREHVAEVDRLLPEIDPFSPAAQSIALALNSRIPSEEYERARGECGAIVAGARAAGMIGMLPFPMAVEADACHRLGDWDAADERSAEAVALAEETGQRGPLQQALVIRVWLLAGRGEEDAGRKAAERALAIAEPAGFGAVTTFVRAGLGFLELGLGRVSEAIAELEWVAGFTAEHGLDEPTLIPWVPDLVEAYVQAGRTDDAERAAALLAEQAERAGGAFARSLAARAEGLVATDFDRPFELAYELDDQRPAPFERARTALAHGRRLHRSRRRVAARKRLREALATFERLGAQPWAERTRAELRASGAAARRPAGDADELTPHEARIARAVARGASNKQVAAELFLSPKTIEFHLSRIYRKLGIRSRTELAARVAEDKLDATPSVSS